MNAHTVRLILAIEHGPKKTKDLTLPGDYTETTHRQLTRLHERGIVLSRMERGIRVWALSRAGYLMARAFHAIDEDATIKNWWEQGGTERARSKAMFNKDGSFASGFGPV